MTAVATRSPLRTLNMSTQRPPRRRSARLAFGGEEEEGRSPSMENGSAPVKRVKKDEAKADPSTASGTERPRRKKAATYDEEDGGFRFTRTRSKKVPVPPSIPEDEPVHRDATADAVETGASADDARPRRRRSARTAAAEELRAAPERRRPKSSKADAPIERDPRDDGVASAPHVEVMTVDDTQKIALPFSDTPVITRNKEFRQQGRKGHRRSSTGWRGRRASSLMEHGSDALPHPDVLVAEYYKHIAGEGLSEPRRMKQLLTWCGARALDDHSPRTSSTATSTLAATVLKDLLQAFSRRSEMSDWFSREIRAAVEVVPKPNPRNAASLAKIEELEQRVTRLQEERRTWERLATQPTLSLSAPADSSGSASQSASAPAPALASESATPGPPPADSTTGTRHPLSSIDDSLLDAHQSTLLSNLLDSTTSSSSSSSSSDDLLRSAPFTLRALTDSLEMTIDRLAQGVHRVGQYHVTAERVGARILASAATRLAQRQQAVLTRTGTHAVPMQEVLRSLAAIER